MYLTLDADATAQNGLYRIIYSDATREAGQPGSTHPLLVTKVSDTSVRLTWEDMKYSAFVGTPYARANTPPNTPCTRAPFRSTPTRTEIPTGATRSCFRPTGRW